MAELVDRRWQAEVDRAPVDPLTDTWPDLSVDDANAVQSHNVDRRVAAGAVVIELQEGDRLRRVLGFAFPTGSSTSATPISAPPSGRSVGGPADGTDTTNTTDRIDRQERESQR